MTVRSLRQLTDPEHKYHLRPLPRLAAARHSDPLEIIRRAPHRSRLAGSTKQRTRPVPRRCVTLCTPERCLCGRLELRGRALTPRVVDALLGSRRRAKLCLSQSNFENREICSSVAPSAFSTIPNFFPRSYTACQGSTCSASRNVARARCIMRSSSTRTSLTESPR